jgi:hypothetical protein
MATSLTCWRCGACFERFHDGGGTARPDTGQVTHATTMSGHREHVRFDCRPAALMTVVDEQRWIGTARRRTAVSWFPVGRDAMFHHVGVLTRGTPHREEGHDARRYPA